MITQKKNTSPVKRRLVIVSVTLFLFISILWLLFSPKESLEPLANELAVIKTTANVVEAQNDYITANNKDSECSQEGVIDAQSLLYYQGLLGANLHNTNFAMLQLGGRRFELPNGDFEMTGYHKYLENLDLSALEKLAESGDQEAMVALSDRLTRKWVTDYRKPLAHIHTNDFTLENPDFVVGLEGIDLMIENPEYKRARDWAIKAAEHGKFSPLNDEIIEALDEHHTFLTIKYKYVETDEERERITPHLEALEEEYYKMWHIYQYTFEGMEDEGGASPTTDFHLSYVPHHLSKNQLSKVVQESIEMMKQLESKVRNNGAMMPRELMAQIQFIKDPEDIIGADAPTIYSPEELVSRIGNEEFAKYSAMIEDGSDLEEALNCISKWKKNNPPPPISTQKNTTTL